MVVESQALSTASVAATQADGLLSFLLDPRTIRVSKNVRALATGDAFRELALSVADVGVLQPLIVMRHGLEIEVVAGHRRLAAALEAKLPLVPCVELPTGYDQTRRQVLQLSENLHRTNLAPLEEAIAFRELMEAHQKATGRRCGQSGLAKMLCLRQPYVSERLSLLKLSPSEQEQLANGKLTLKAALKRVAPATAKPAVLSPGDKPQAPVRKASFRDRGTGLRLDAIAEGDAKPTRADLVAAVRRWLEVLEKQAARS